MKLGLYPKIAADGIRKNGRLYVPYIATSILMIAVYYIMHVLGFSDMIKNIMGETTARTMLQLGTRIMALFGAIFLFYTQSTLIKGRLKEFGLYSVLGMNKRNLSRIIFCETVMTWAMSMTGGLLAGIGLSKLAELGFARMINADVSYNFYVSGESLMSAFTVYSVIFFLIFLNAVRQIRFSRTINLVNADKAGEKPPKANWVVGILGLLILSAGYIIAIKIESPLSALFWFFIAVILIIVGTYLVLITGSVVFCRILQKNKNYYYKTNHFVSVSSMTYRMKRNGAGLASICILLTMILVTISSTAALYFNREETLQIRYPNEINVSARDEGLVENYKERTAKMEHAVNKCAEENGAVVSNTMYFSSYGLSGYYDNNGTVDIELDPYATLSATLDYDRVVQVFFFDLETYNRLNGKNETLEPGKILLGIDGNIQVGDKIAVGNKSFNIEKKVDFKDGKMKNAVGTSLVSTLVLIVNDLNETVADYAGVLDTRGEPMLVWLWNYNFDTGLEPEGQMELRKKLGDAIHDELDDPDFVRYYSFSREAERQDFVSTFGGLFFLGILLSTIFMVSCVLIIYYKQISEGFEDQSRFSIMQKVGMTKENIKKSINSQMLTVFLIPILFSCVHLAVVLPIIHKLLMLFGHNNIPLLLVSAGICVLVCGIFYAFIYKLTSNAYYKIVS
ncbi:MAG: ABC transporter permease [Clostridiales bacterium]|nr:ABC transporter permease [Clostridiales bacterium]